MIIFVIGLLLIFYGIFTKKYSVWIGMLFVLLIMGFQEGIPGDYMSYKYYFEHRGIGTDAIGYTIKEDEFVFIWMSKTLSRFMNFHTFVLLTSIIQCLVMGLMVKSHAVKKYQYFGVLLIFFTFNIMLIQMKAMRQGYAIDLLLLAYYLLSKRKYVWSLLPALLAYGCHNSSIIAILFFAVLWVMMFFRRKEKKDAERVVVVNNVKGMNTAMFVLGGLLVFYFLKYIVLANYINPILEGIEMFSYHGYLNQIENRSISWWIMLYHAISVFAVALYYVNEHNQFRKYLALLMIVELFLSVGTFGFGNLMRTTAYFICFSIVVYPNVAAMLRVTYGKNIASVFVLFTMGYLILTSVRPMMSNDVSSGTGFGPFTFSFLNW